MKRIFLIITTSLLVMSCLNDYTMTESGTVGISFEFPYNYAEMFGTDSLYYVQQENASLVVNVLGFNNVIEKDSKEFVGGFIFSYMAVPESGTEGLENNLYRANNKLRKGEKNTFAVYSQHPDQSKNPERDIVFIYPDNGTCTITSCYVNNTVAVADAVQENFVDGDRLLLKARGWKKDVETGTAEITLADWSTQKDSLVSSWTKFDLSALGAIDRVDLEIIAPEGKDIPKAVCIDDVSMQISLTY